MNSVSFKNVIYKLYVYKSYIRWFGIKQPTMVDMQ